MQGLRSCPEIATPHKNISCVDDELLHPRQIHEYAGEYGRLTGRRIATPGQLMQAFYQYNAGFAFAGFKSMPNRHTHFHEFTRQPGIRFITLVRMDIPSTVASFLTAMLTGCWRRDGGRQDRTWTFEQTGHGPLVAANLAYVLDSFRLIESIPDAIRLTYEDLCREDFHSPELDRYFQRPIRLANPQPPTHAGSYLANWDEFVEFIARLRNEYSRARRCPCPANKSRD